MIPVCRIMHKLGISLLFFTLCLATTSLAAHTRIEKRNSIPNADSLIGHADLDSTIHNMALGYYLDSIWHGTNFDSFMRELNVDSIMHQMDGRGVLKHTIDSIWGRLNIDSIIKHVNVDSLWKAAHSKLNSLFEGAFFKQNFSESPSGTLAEVTGTGNGFRIDPMPNGTNPLLEYHYPQTHVQLYLDVVPLGQKAIQVDHSDAWLIRGR